MSKQTKSSSSHGVKAGYGAHSPSSHSVGQHGACKGYGAHSEGKHSVAGHGAMTGFQHKAVPDIHFADRNPMNDSHDRTQFEPTDANPVRMHQQYAGEKAGSK